MHHDDTIEIETRTGKKYFFYINGSHAHLQGS